MSRYLHAISQSTSTVRTQRWTIGVLAVITVIALLGWKYKDTQLTAHIPPDLSNGATIKIGGNAEVPPANVYAFGFYIWQQINNWPNDGVQDYGKQLFSLQQARGLNILSHQGSGAGEYLQGAGLQVIYSNNEALNLSMLQRQRARLWATSAAVAPKARRKARATATPMLPTRPAPVTIATLPASLPICSPLFPLR